ncbi:hypothetical protein PMI15_03377 [Polaromonas sp. CF318]|uniref:hypothetical protein n=1 Tax=Polaromonas sp. CF318 TaxID=1144318 RepID=UPI00027126ED|nr:hypothetical protein [Polaromonas sp. CF318]EJL81547.1 hypothetical protein PMI15_03377 [Polaromonas sp. CF318]
MTAATAPLPSPQASEPAANDSALEVPPLGRPHARRLREIYRSAGWPCQDLLEIELLATGMLQRVAGPAGHETLRVTDAGIAYLAATLLRNRSALSKHEALVEQVACEMVRAGRIAWRGLGLRAQLPPEAEGGKARWCVVRPDVFSIRNTTVQEYVDPIVHEIKVHRSDLLGDLRRPEKRAAYLDLGGECWYVLGCDAKGRPIGAADEVPSECGVMLMEGQHLVVARAAPRRSRQSLPLGVWMALAKATPVAGLNDDEQGMLGDCEA